jgi:hypothetical protein
MEITQIERLTMCYDFYVVDNIGNIALMYNAGGELPKSVASSIENHIVFACTPPFNAFY